MWTRAHGASPTHTPRSAPAPQTSPVFQNGLLGCGLALTPEGPIFLQDRPFSPHETEPQTCASLGKPDISKVVWAAATLPAVALGPGRVRRLLLSPPGSSCQGRCAQSGTVMPAASICHKRAVKGHMGALSSLRHSS